MKYITTGDVVMQDSLREATSKMGEPEVEPRAITAEVRHRR